MKAYHFKYVTLNNGPVNIYTIITRSQTRALELFNNWTDRHVFYEDAYLYLEYIYTTEICGIYAYKFIFTSLGSFVIREGHNLLEALRRLSDTHDPSEVIDVEVTNV